jgi:ketosteroid isomerase-like protein
MAKVKPVFHTPDEAEQAFYQAFEAGDVEQMMGVWANDEEVECIHPVGPRLAGRAAIRDGWIALFSNPRAMRFRISDRRREQCDTLAIHIVHENVRLGDSDKRYPPLVATNIYRLTDNGWRMILHHASPTPGRTDTEEEAPATVLH